MDDDTYNLEVVVFRRDPDGHLVLESGEPVSDRQIAVATLLVPGVEKAPRGALAS